MELQASRSEALNNKLRFKQQAKLVVGEALASPPSPGEWRLKPWTLDFCTPPRRQQRFSRKGSQNAGAEHGVPPPPGVGVGFEGGKKKLGNCFWPLLARSWGAQKHQKHPPERQERAKRRQETKKRLPGSILGGILAPKMMIFGFVFRLPPPPCEPL